MRKPLTISIEEELIKKIKRICIDKGIDVSDKIEMWIKHEKEKWTKG